MVYFLRETLSCPLSDEISGEAFCSCLVFFGLMCPKMLGFSSPHHIESLPQLEPDVVPKTLPHVVWAYNNFLSLLDVLVPKG
jgi:hypothetical protein